MSGTAPRHFALVPRAQQGLVALLAATLLPACGPSDGASPTQTLARVNDREITVHQLNHALRRHSAPSEDAAQPLRAAQLQRMVDEALLVEQAERDRLHRDPAVLHALQAARREVLAQAWIGARVEQVPPPTEDEVRAAYDAAPDLYAARRIWRLREIVVQGEGAPLDQWRQRVRQARDLAEFDRALRESGLPRRESQQQQPAESLPPALLERLVKMRDGQLMILAAIGGERVIVRVGTQPAALAFETVRPALARRLHQERRQALAHRLVQALREGARIDYFGEGAALAGRGASAAAASAATSAAAGATP